MFNQPQPSQTFPLNGRNPMQVNPGLVGSQPPMPGMLPPPGPPPAVPGAGLMDLQPGGYRGGPATSIGRGNIDFSNFPGAQNGVSPMMSGRTVMSPGQQIPPMGSMPIR